MSTNEKILKTVKSGTKSVSDMLNSAGSGASEVAMNAAVAAKDGVGSFMRFAFSKDEAQSLSTTTKRLIENDDHVGRLRRKVLSPQERFMRALTGSSFQVSMLVATVCLVGVYFGVFGRDGIIFATASALFAFLCVPDERPWPMVEIPVVEAAENMSPASILAFAAKTVVDSDFLTQSMKANVSVILEKLEKLLPQVSNAMFDEKAFTVRQTALDYLPSLLSDYAAIPQSSRTRPVDMTGTKTPEIVLEESLSQMRASLEKMEQDFASGNVSAFMSNGRFLEERFGRHPVA